MTILGVIIEGGGLSRKICRRHMQIAMSVNIFFINRKLLTENDTPEHHRHSNYNHRKRQIKVKSC